jgi:Fe-S cluster assembly protein SufD
VYVPRGVRLEQPVEYIVAHASDDAAITPRALVVLEEQAEATFVEELLSTDGELAGFSNGVTELVVGAGAHLHYTSIQDYAVPVTHFATHRVLAGRDAQVEWNAVGLGASLGKVRMEVRLAGAGAHVKLTGAYFADGRQELDYDTQQFHEAPNATSDLSFKGALSGKAKSVWRGMINVSRGAQGTDAYQENRNLLLQPTAHADSIPGLQIEANEVRCTHGATISKVDPEQLFYLQARGIHRADAVATIVRGFYAPTLDRISSEPLRNAVRDALEARIEQG